MIWVVVKLLLEDLPKSMPFQRLDALKAISRYSNEKPFILPVEAMLAVQPTSASSSLLIKVKRSGVSAKLLSIICWRASFGGGKASPF